MTPEKRQDTLQTLLRQAFSPSELKIINESHLHAGHAGAQSGASHFAIEISSEKLMGLKKVEQHKKIYAAVGHLIPSEIHALRINIL